MPASIDSTISGYITFTAIKLAGYSLFSLRLNQGYAIRRNPLVVGATRTAMGMALGSLYFLSWRTLGHETHTPFYWIGLLPIRVFEWGLLIALFYDRGFRQKSEAIRVVLAGIVLSYILDLPAGAGFLICGLSIC